jgi:hypothetical protein
LNIIDPIIKKYHYEQIIFNLFIMPFGMYPDQIFVERYFNMMMPNEYSGPVKKRLSLDEQNKFMTELLDEIKSDDLTAFLREISIMCTFEHFKMIVDVGADPRADNDYLFIQSCRVSKPEILTYLLELGADANTQNGNPLCQASECNNLAAVKILLANGAKITNGAIEIAVGWGSYEIVKYFLEQGANPNIVLSKIFSSVTGFGGDYPGQTFTSMLKLVNKYEPNYDLVIKNF